MNKKLILLFLVVTPLLFARADELPAQLKDYEASLPRRLTVDQEREKRESTIGVIVAAGDGDIVKKESKLRLPVGATALDAATVWQKEKRGMLIGWSQGLVIIIRKHEDKVSRTAWSQREAREAGRKFILHDGDALIGLVYGDY